MTTYLILSHHPLPHIAAHAARQRTTTSTTTPNPPA